MEQPPSSPPDTTQKPMSLGGIYKFGKLAQAQSYRDQLRLARDNAAAGLAHAWGMAKAATGIGAGEATVGNPDDNIAIDSPVTNHYHQPAPSQLGKLLLGAGLLATGVGVPIGAALVANGGKEVAEKVVERVVEKPVSSQDANTRYKLRLWRPSE